jgi:hypothetical protein
LLLATTLTGCASGRLSSEPPPGERLAGDWKLDVARSDDLGKAVAALRAQVGKTRHGSGAGAQQQGSGGHAGHGRRGQQGGQQSGQAGQDESAQAPESGDEGVGVVPAPHASPVDELMSNVPRGDYLGIKVSPNAFTVTSGDSSEEYTPGLESEISAEQGDAQQISGWKGADYVIDTKPQWGAEILQTYTLTKDGRLMLTVRLTGDRTKFTFTRVYDRTTQVAPLAPPTIN